MVRRLTDLTFCPGHWIAMSNIIRHESNFNPYAENSSSGAYGICQALPASKMITAGSDYLTNPQTQAEWCMGYVRDRYGTPTNAWNFWVSHGWY